VISALKELQMVDIVQAADDWIYDAEKRASTSIMLFGNTHHSEYDQLLSDRNDIITNVEQLKAYRGKLKYMQ
jgi:hypothetical protein